MRGGAPAAHGSLLAKYNQSFSSTGAYCLICRQYQMYQDILIWKLWEVHGTVFVGT